TSYSSEWVKEILVQITGLTERSDPCGSKKLSENCLFISWPMCMHRVRLRLGSGSLKGSGASDCVCFLWVTSSQAHAMQIAITNYFLFVEHGGVFSCSPGTEVGGPS
ncbi:hypothetical protein XENOCAPTIV_015944, partial [Xenoophorus captivus]